MPRSGTTWAALIGVVVILLTTALLIWRPFGSSDLSAESTAPPSDVSSDTAVDAGNHVKKQLGETGRRDTVAGDPVFDITVEEVTRHETCAQRITGVRYSLPKASSFSSGSRPMLSRDWNHWPKSSVYLLMSSSLDWVPTISRWLRSAAYRHSQGIPMQPGAVWKKMNLPGSLLVPEKAPRALWCWMCRRIRTP